LIGRLHERRCLLVLDNLETLLEVDDPEGNYRAGYEGYGRLLERLGEAAHRSCVVLTSREKPREIEALEGLRGPVRSLRLSGLSQEAARSRSWGRPSSISLPVTSSRSCTRGS
jgi:hypothetical protein